MREWIVRNLPEGEIRNLYDDPLTWCLLVRTDKNEAPVFVSAFTTLQEAVDEMIRLEQSMVALGSVIIPRYGE